jgi:hypothetical protein
MNHEHLEYLIREYFDSDISSQDLGDLDSLLRVDPEARKRFLAESRLHAALRTIGLEKAQKLRLKAATARRSWRGWRSLLRGRSIAAALGGIVVGILSTSIAMAYISATYSSPKLMKRSLALPNSGFEQLASHLPASVPADYGRWGGDGKVVANENGVFPVEGGQMLRFVPRVAVADGSTAFRAAVAQVVDVRRWRNSLQAGKAVVEYSASFNGAVPSDSTETTYRIDVRAYAGDVNILQKPFPDRFSQEVAHSMWRTHADFDSSSWQRLSGSLILPPETDFLVIEPKVFRPAHHDASVASESAYYVDDVHLSLNSESNE